MSADQTVLFALLALLFVFLIWGRWRYDLVAFAALVVALFAGLVPVDEAFSGFGHPATVIVALVLVVSRALSNSGVVEWIGRVALSGSRSVMAHIGLMSAIAAGLSAIMNNVAALALLMPVDMQAAAKSGRNPALTLMPLSFASILGGLVTLIGTPPNIVVASFRADALGEPFAMFDFAPVGLACAVVGTLFVALVGWRLLPASLIERDSSAELRGLAEYIAELVVPQDSSAVGKRVSELDEAAEENDAAVIGLVRGGQRLAGTARHVRIRTRDVLVVEAEPEGIDKLVGALGLEYLRPSNDEGGDGDGGGDAGVGSAARDAGDDRKVGGDRRGGAGVEGDLSLLEVVVPQGARIEHRTASSLHLLSRHDVTLLGVSRQGRRFREQVRKLAIRAGDVLLLLGPADRLAEVTSWLGCLPLAERGLKVLQRDKALLSVSVFVAAIAAATLGVVHLAVALAGAAVLLVATRAVPLRELYESVEWPVIVLLGSMIPLGAALESTGSTELIASAIAGLAQDHSPVAVLVLLMVITMTLSDVMNNTATTVIAAPIAFDISNRLDVDPDAFLMGVAVAASCAFLTPIGHKNNTLIMGPGGYRFGDYWRMGLPLEVLVLAVGVPAILWVWPL